MTIIVLCKRRIISYTQNIKTLSVNSEILSNFKISLKVSGKGKQLSKSEK